jgi:hypothetical protein
LTPDQLTTDQFMKKQVSAGSSTRIETRNFVIHVKPRISATKLAEYIIANPTRQAAIAKNAKVAPKVIITPYKRTRSSLSEAFTASGISQEKLLAIAQDSRNSTSGTPWTKEDNIKSSDLIVKMATVSDKINCAGGTLIERPGAGWGGLSIEGVTVSVNPELIFSIDHRGVKKVGAVILNTGKAASLSLSRSNGTQSVADYLTALVYRLLDQNLSTVGAPIHTKCYAIDINRSLVHTAPAAHKTLNKHIEEACRMIAMRWDSIVVNPDEDPDAAVTGDE